MRTLAALLFLAFGAAGSATAQNETVTMPDRPELFVSLTPETAADDGVRVQSQIVLRLRLASARRFERLSLALPETIEGAEVIRLFRPRTREVRSYASDGWVFEAVFAVFPQRSGTLMLPPVEAVGAVAGDDGEDLPFTERWPGATVSVAGIPEAWGDAWWMVADRVEIRERWSIPPESVRQEDVLRREVTVIAHGVPAERMAPPEFAPARRVAITEAGRFASTETSGTGVVGTIVRAWDIEVGDAVTVDLPPVRVAWWDAGADAAARSVAPALRLEPLPADRAALAAELMAEAAREHRGARRVAVVLGGLAAAPILAFAAIVLWRLRPDPADRRMRAVCNARRGPLETLRAVEGWSRARGGRPDPARHPEAAERLRGLEAAVFGAGPPPDPVRLAEALLSAARRDRLAALRRAGFAALDAVLGRPVDLPGPSERALPSTTGRSRNGVDCHERVR